MPQQFVRIVNRGSVESPAYTNSGKAKYYVDTELAEVFLLSLSRRVLEIRMLEAAELALLKTRMTRERRIANQDDGIQRRYVNTPSGIPKPSESAINGKLLGVRMVEGKPVGGDITRSPGGIDVKQLLPIAIVGTGKHVGKVRDELSRRHGRNDKGKSLVGFN